MEQREEISPEKLRGGYYTPSSITDFIVNWGMEISPSNILEPSSGDGAFNLYTVIQKKIKIH
mgnify:CR=1 FL=1